MTVYCLYTLEYGHIQFVKINAHNSRNPLFPMTSHYSLTMWKQTISIVSNVISFLEIFQLTFLKLANAHLKFQLATVRLQRRSLKSTKCWNRLCGHSSAIRNVSTFSFKRKHDFSDFWWQICQGIQVPGWYPRQVPGRKNSCWELTVSYRDWFVFWTPCSIFLSHK